MERSDFMIGLNNDRDEVYDDVNVVYRIYVNQETYNLSDFELKTIIKVDSGIFIEKTIKIPSFSFTDSISIKKLNLKDNNFYRVESTLINKKDNKNDVSSYPFKKIKNKINRSVSYDKYGRMFVNGELFFPLAIVTSYYREPDLNLINQTHINMYSGIITKGVIDKIYSTFQGKVKIICPLNFTSFLNANTIEQKEENYKKNIVEKVNEFKDHPALLAWYVNDEVFSFYHEDLRNITLTVHELDPNHPTASIIMPFGEMSTLLNTTDIAGNDNYPLTGSEIRLITDMNTKACEEPIGKPKLPMIQIVDLNIYYKY